MQRLCDPYMHLYSTRQCYKFPQGNTFTSKAIDYIITNEDSQIEDMKDDFFLFRG